MADVTSALDTIPSVVFMLPLFGITLSSVLPIACCRGGGDAQVGHAVADAVTPASVSGCQRNLVSYHDRPWARPIQL